MIWYRFTVDPPPSSTLEDVTETFLDALVNARSAGAAREPRFGLFKSRKSEGKHATCYAFIDPDHFRSFIDENGAIECEAPQASDVEHLAGVNVLQVS